MLWHRKSECSKCNKRGISYQRVQWKSRLFPKNINVAVDENRFGFIILCSICSRNYSEIANPPYAFLSSCYPALLVILNGQLAGSSFYIKLSEHGGSAASPVQSERTQLEYQMRSLFWIAFFWAFAWHFTRQRVCSWLPSSSTIATSLCSHGRHCC